MARTLRARARGGGCRDDARIREQARRSVGRRRPSHRRVLLRSGAGRVRSVHSNGVHRRSDRTVVPAAALAYAAQRVDARPSGITASRSLVLRRGSVGARPTADGWHSGRPDFRRGPLHGKPSRSPVLVPPRGFPRRPPRRSYPPATYVGRTSAFADAPADRHHRGPEVGLFGVIPVDERALRRPSPRSPVDPRVCSTRAGRARR